MPSSTPEIAERVPQNIIIMGYHRRRKWAYYSRNQSYSRSANAENAEANGRLPRTRAAAALNVNVAAFDAGCIRAGYVSTEWHHVGKYATPVNYYDTNELSDNIEFWNGALEAYKSRESRERIQAIIAQLTAAQHQPELQAA